MPQEETRTLIAKWKPEQDGSVELPHTIYWSDGSRASSEDYLDHILDTHTFSSGADGVEVRMFPDIVGDVSYDVTAQQWVISGDRVQPAALDISDRSAPDESILAELATWPTVYRVRVHRRL